MVQGICQCSTYGKIAFVSIQLNLKKPCIQVAILPQGTLPAPLSLTYKSINGWDINTPPSVLQVDASGELILWCNAESVNHTIYDSFAYIIN